MCDLNEWQAVDGSGYLRKGFLYLHNSSLNLSWRDHFIAMCVPMPVLAYIVVQQLDTERISN